MHKLIVHCEVTEMHDFTCIFIRCRIYCWSPEHYAHMLIAFCIIPGVQGQIRAYSKVHLFTPDVPVEHLTSLFRFREYGGPGFKPGPEKYLFFLLIVVLPFSLSSFKDRRPKIRLR